MNSMRSDTDRKAQSSDTVCKSCKSYQFRDHEQDLVTLDVDIRLSAGQYQTLTCQWGVLPAATTVLGVTSTPLYPPTSSVQKGTLLRTLLVKQEELSGAGLLWISRNIPRYDREHANCLVENNSMCFAYGISISRDVRVFDRNNVRKEENFRCDV